MKSRQIKVKLKERSYLVFIQNDLLKNCAYFFSKVTFPKQVAILSTPMIYKTYGVQLVVGLKKLKIDPFIIFIPDGEKQKNERSLFKVLKVLSMSGFQRNSCLIALGGGVVGDLGGMAASLYMRGIDLIQFPTTLLAQVDASIGGKTAIDFAGIKNLIGTFHQPKCVFIDPKVLNTLNDRQFKTGLAEIIKYGIIKDENIFKAFEERYELILKRNSEILFWLINRSCSIKSKIVSDDEKESGKRAWLNYGHTLGHALEAYYQYQVLTHGEAIGHGMWFAALLSKWLGLCSQEVFQRQESVLKRFGLLQKLPKFNPREVYQKMILDKKAKNGQIQFVLTRKIGLVTIQKNVPRSIILSGLTKLQAETTQ
jgi:3-dehydroquinate synthase